MASPYAELIGQLAPDYDPRHIEAYLRCEHGTLDHLSEEQLDGAIDFAKSLVDQGGAEAAETLARSYGLNPERISCGCCKGPEYDRCICHMHQDITRGRPARTCLCHRAGAQAAAAAPAEGVPAPDIGHDPVAAKALDENLVAVEIAGFLDMAEARLGDCPKPGMSGVQVLVVLNWLRSLAGLPEARS